MKQEFIYYLICPLEKSVKYVGKTKNPKARYKTHITKLDKTNTPKKMWLLKLFEQKLLPYLEIKESYTNPETARKMEQFHLDLHSDTALNIHNPEKGKESKQWSGHDWNVNKKD